MKNLPKKFGTLKYSLVTILILLIPIVYFFFYRIPDQESYFTSRNLRLLGDMSKHISEKIEGYKKVIDNVIIKNSLIKDEIENSLKKDPSASIDSLVKTPKVKNIVKKQIAGIEQLEFEDSRIKPGFKLLDSLVKKQMKSSRNGLSRADSVLIRRKFSQIKFGLELNGHSFRLHMNYLGQRVDEDSTGKYIPAGTYTIELNLHASLKEIITPFLKPRIFDDILLVEYGKNDEKGRVIYQVAQEEFIASRLDSLSGNLKETWSSSNDEVVWGNTHYKLYVQPVRIAVLSDAHEIETEGDIEWMLVGLVESKKFSALSRTISPFVISLFVFVVLLVLISMPLFKLQFIGEREELKRSDLLLTVFSLFIGAGVLTFFMLSLYSDGRDKKNLDTSLKPLARKIETNFNAEVDSLIRQIQDLSKKIPDDTTGFRITSILSDSIYKKDNNIESVPYPYFDQVAWIAENGLQHRKVGTDTSLTPLVNVSSRAYFQKIKNRQGWYRKGEKSERAYYIQPIISITTGANSAVLTIPDTVITANSENTSSHSPAKSSGKKTVVTAITVNFISLLNTVIPKGTGFCIIDETGEVLFHSEQKKNLQENFFTECDDNPRLHAVVYSRVEKSIKVDYLGRIHHLYVQPLKDTPWTLITFADLNLIRSYELNALTIATLLFSMLVLFCLFVIIFFYVINFFKDFNWLWPQEKLDRTYQFITVFLFCLAGFYYAVIFGISANANLHVALILPPVIIALVYVLIRNRIEFSTLKNLSKPWKWALLISAFLVVALTFWFAFSALIHGVIGLLIGAILSSDQISVLFNRDKFREYYARFALFGVAFLLITSILPAIAFFKISYDSELEVFVKQGQLSLLNGIEERKIRIEKELNEQIFDKHDPRKDDSLRQILLSKRMVFENSWDVYSDFFSHTLISDSATFDDLLKEQLKKNATTSGNPVKEIIQNIFKKSDSLEVHFEPAKISTVDPLLAWFRSRLRIVRPESWELYQETTADSLWEWKEFDGKILRLEKNIPGGSGKKYIASTLNYFQRPVATIWFVGMPLIMILLILVLLYFVYKVFTIDVILILPSQSKLSALQSEKIFLNTIYIGRPNSGKSAFTRKIKNAYQVDFRKFSTPDKLLNEVKNIGEIKDNYEVFILDHFDRNMENKNWNIAKLYLLENLVSILKKTVLIVTSVDPAKILADKVNEKEVDEENKLSKDILHRWTLVLSTFTKVYHSVEIDYSDFSKFVELNCPTTALDNSDAKINERRELLCNTIINECRHTPFLQRVGKEVIVNLVYDEEYFNKSLLIDEILQRAEAYYQSIWSVCSIEEKITLYHLARNGFVTPKDAGVVRLLMRKGLIRKEYRLSLFNESFRKFVLTAEPATVIEEWKLQQKRSWGNVRTPLVTALIVAILFLFVTQREMFNESIAWISAFVAAIPALLKFLNFFKPGGTKPAETS